MRAEAGRQTGMTLVEVLVALAILGMTAASIMMLIAQNTRFVAASEDRAIAAILLDNVMVETLASTAALELGASEEARDFVGRDWRVMRTIGETGLEGVVRIEVEILTADGQTLARAETLRRRRR